MQTITVSQENDIGLQAQLVHHSENTDLSNLFAAVHTVQGFDLTDLLKAIDKLAHGLILNSRHPVPELRGTKSYSAKFGSINISFNPHLAGVA